MKTIGERIKYLIDIQGITPYILSRRANISDATVSRLLNDVSDRPNSKTLGNLSNYFHVSEKWLITGEGTMLNENLEEETDLQKAIKRTEKEVKELDKPRLIPLYDDVATIGGYAIQEEMHGVSRSTEYIEAGSWFGKEVTAAIRHYGESMTEYPSGCILALREILDFQNVIWGQNYVIETNEIRVTKRLQRSEDDNYIMAYSTNFEIYPDGKQIYEPFRIEKSKINHIFSVLGRIVKEHSSGVVKAG